MNFQGGLVSVLARLGQIPGFRTLWCRFPFGSLETRVRYGIWRKGSYASYFYGTYRAAHLARRLGLSKISVIEFGVAGGIGLLELEVVAELVAREFDIVISVYGFDTDKGMPVPIDYRDLPYIWGQGFYRMDGAKLSRRLKRASLILGPVEQTLHTFVERPDIAPVGFISFDLDFYSSTKAALRIFDAPTSSRLPRVYCYFDDIVWPETACHNDYIGELCAIREYNEEHQRKKLAPPHLMRRMMEYRATWHDQIYIHHDFEHPLYCHNLTPEGDAYRQLHL